MTLAELEGRLKSAGVAEYRLEAALLAEHFCGISRARLAFLGEERLESEQLEDAVLRREAGEPVQYILGEWEFMNEKYAVSRDVLIPRQDTETVVEWAIKKIPENGRFIDLCTGSGCIAVSVLAARKNLSCVAVDKYPETLRTAELNARRNGVSDRMELCLSDVLCDGAVSGPFDLVISNPPYVSAEEYEKLERELYFEPRHALTDGADGLTFYRRILEVYPYELTERGAIAFEIGSTQAEAVSSLAEDAGFTSQVLKDYSGNDRALICIR